MNEISPEMRDALRYVIRRMAGIEGSIRGLAGQSGGAFTGVETGDGKFIYYDDDGNIMTMTDEYGTTVVTTVLGPPIPTDPDVDPGFNSLIINYDGTFIDGDWDDNQIDHVEIHVTALNTDPLDDSNQVGTFTSSNGGTFTYPWKALDGGRWVWLQAVTTAGYEGPASNGVFGVPDAVAPPDGTPPATSPAVSLRGGIKAVFASWLPTPNADPVIYDVYINNGSAPTSTAPFLIASTPGTSIGLNAFVGGAPILPTDVAYVMVVARDADGDGPDGAVASASPVTIDTIDVTALAITGPTIAASSITAAKIVAGTITSNEIAANTIVAGDIAASTIVAANIAANTITAAQIAAGTITATEIAAGTIVAANIAANTITAAQIAAGTITTGLLTATAIDGMTITGAIFRTAASGQRMEMKNDVSAGVLQFYTGSAGEVTGYLNPNLFGGTQPQVTLRPPSDTTYADAPTLDMRSGVAGGAGVSLISLHGGQIFIDGNTDGFDSLVLSNGRASFPLAYVAGSTYLGSQSMPLSCIRWGVSSATANGSGQVTVTHSMNPAPAQVMLSIASRDRTMRVVAITGTTFTVEGYVASTNTLLTSGQVCSFNWLGVG